MATIELKDLDWGLLWQQANKQKKQRRKGPDDWNRKADSFAQRTAQSVYIEKFIELLAPEPDWSVLDIGCGPGTLALPLAALTRQVTALDFSETMLKILDKKAGQQGVNNLSTHCIAWEDDWVQHGIKPHDVAIASRSLAVHDLKKALSRLNSFATKKVCITDRVKHGPRDPDAFAAVGRKLHSGPDYIYTINLLYQMGILPTVDYIRLEQTLIYPSFEEALSSFAWMFNKLSNNEEKLLKKYVQSITTIEENGMLSVHRRYIPTWAFISWAP